MKEFDVICDTGENGEMLPVGLYVDRNNLPIRGISDRWYDKKANYFKVAASDIDRLDLTNVAWLLP